MSENLGIAIIEKYKEFFEDLKAKDIMNPTVIVLKENDTMIDAKDVMRRRQISGIPIVDDTNELIGIVTMEDLIKALEGNNIRKKIKVLGRKKVICLHENDDLQKIVEYISTFRFGRYPVVDDNNKVIGIITKLDLLFGVISKLSALYLHDERRRQVLDSPLSILIQNQIDKNQPDFLYLIDNQDVTAAGEGSALLKNYLKEKGFSDIIVRKISISTYEAEVNVVIHGGGWGRIAASITSDSVVVFVEDSGAGIEDIEKAMRPGYSTATEYIRSLGFGAGMGLANIKRFTDKLVITSEKNQGVKLEMLFWLKPEVS